MAGMSGGRASTADPQPSPTSGALRHQLGRRPEGYSVLADTVPRETSSVSASGGTLRGWRRGALRYHSVRHVSPCTGSVFVTGTASAAVRNDSVKSGSD
ncbi:MAG: hypothetical protein AVDCRST_MAG87-3514 [uncultured Thermomicrobiales bacterium]|uniref:Uncharacterized protein n=1 Tax=uncultured Thermomicrobiales bacterium TaxID=1645740 RepID=A0A6J4VNI8_9BACT|nr:MAG: hypothetical protein AVDCRST_MAG87-3514 [uncultured Thermomicrobiales bacterium]